MSTPTAPQKSAEEQAPASKHGGSMHHRHALHEAGGAAGGAIAGAALGSIAGPAGAATGAVIGGVVGALAAKVSDEEAERESIREGELDEMIGVNGGDLGAPNLKHPPAIRGTYSAGSSGGGSSGGGEGTASGPIPTGEK